MSLHVGGHADVFRDPAYYCGPGPAVVVDPATGRWTVAFRRVPSWLHEGLAGHWHPSTELCLTHSQDGGATWSPPQVFAAGTQSPNLRRLTDGTLLLHTHRFELVTQEIFERAVGDSAVGGAREGNWPGLQRGTGVWRSTDGGITWGEPAWLGGVPGVEPLHPSLAPALAVRGNLLIRSTGELLVSAYSLGDDNTSHLFASSDQGASWSWRAPIAADANETCLHETDGGDLLAFVRRHREPDVLHACRSTDGGQTWSGVEPVCRGFPACAARLPSGRVLLVYGYRFAQGYGTRARVLDADGDPASAGDEVVLRDDGAGTDLGYPDVAVLPDGRIGVVFYHTVKGENDDPAQATRFVAACVVDES